MIYTKQDLKEFLKYDLAYFYSQKNTKGKIIKSILSGDKEFCYFRFVKFLRISEFYLNNYKNESNSFLKRIICRIKYLLLRRHLNHLRIKYNIEIYENVFDKGITIYHSGIVVHPDARVGENCKLHGDNCIGNDGTPKSASPQIGNNVSLGVGSKIIGDIRIADNITIAAGAVVVNSFLEPGIMIAGVPAEKKNGYENS